MTTHLVRRKLRERLAAAQTNGQHTIITAYKRPIGVLVPFTWWAKTTGYDGEDELEETA